MSDSLEEINLIDILKKIYNSRKHIFYVSIAFSIIGVIVAILSPVTYKSSTTFIPQSQESTSSSLSGVASLVGINLGSQKIGGEIPFTMYPEVADSPKFKRLILESTIDEKNKISLKSFITNHYKLKESEKNNQPSIFVSEFEENCFKILSNIISVNVNDKDGFVSISSSMPVAEYSAILANTAKQILQKIIIEYKIESAKQNLKFIENQLFEKKIEFDKIQAKLSYFKDSNLNLVNSSILDQQDKIEAEAEIINAVVTELSKQVEQAKLQVTKDTPVFSTIKEAVVPNQRTSPQRTKLVITFTIIGIFISTIYFVNKDFVSKIFKEIKNN